MCEWGPRGLAVVISPKTIACADLDPCKTTSPYAFMAIAFQGFFLLQVNMAVHRSPNTSPLDFLYNPPLPSPSHSHTTFSPSSQCQTHPSLQLLLSSLSSVSACESHSATMEEDGKVAMLRSTVVAMHLPRWEVLVDMATYTAKASGLTQQHSALHCSTMA
ncbi:hypothetical protein V6N13_141073 [Hibiscus sabdariffa]